MTVAQMHNFFNTGQPSYVQQPPPSQSWRVFERDNVQVQHQQPMWPSNLAPPPQPPNLSASGGDDVILLDQDPHAPLILPPPPPMPSLLVQNGEPSYPSRRNDGSRWDVQFPRHEQAPENHFDDRESIRTPTSDDGVIIIGECGVDPVRRLTPALEQPPLLSFEAPRRDVHLPRATSPPKASRTRPFSRSPVRRRSATPQRRDSRVKSPEKDIYRRLQDDLLNKYSKYDRGSQNRRDREDRYSRQRTRSPERRRPVHRSRSRSPLERRRERSPIASRRRSRSPAARRRSRSPAARRRSRSPVPRRRSRSPDRQRYRESSERRRSPVPRRRVSPAVSRRRSPDSRRRSRSPAGSRHRRPSRERTSRRKSPEVRSSSSRTSTKKPEETAKKSDSETSSFNTEEDPLQAFAKQFDPEEFRKKLQRKMMSKLKEKIAEESRQREEQHADEGSEEGEVVTPVPSSTDIRLYYDKSDDSNDENAYHPETVASESDAEKEPSEKATPEENYDTDQASTPRDEHYADVEMSDAETPAYPWYINSPIQQEIAQKFLELSKLEGNGYEQRPQQPEQDGIVRTFPVKKRGFVANEQQKRVAHYDNTFDDVSNGTLYAPLARPSSNSRFQGMVKESGKGYVVRGHGTLSWIRRDKYTDANPVPPAAVPEHPVFTNGYINHECYEYMQNKKCQAGALCKFNHDGDDSHRRISFCYRFLNGLCRNGDKCPNGSHALLPHQIPVCDYFLRMSCPHRTGCTFLHVKHSDSVANCIHFNKGRCLSAFPCPYVHRYTPIFIRERCKHVAGTKEDLQRAEEEAESTASINFDDIVPLEWYQ